MEPNTWRGRDTFSKILSLPICASCMPNVLGFRRVLQHPRKVYFPTVRDSNVWDGKLHEIVNDKSQPVISSVLSSTKFFNELSSLWKMHLAKTVKSWKKYFPSFAVFLLSISYVFYLCLWFVFDWWCGTSLFVRS